MIDRLPKRLHPQRRHLTFVVGLLTATFVLTAALAYRARRSEVDLQRLANQRLTEYAMAAAQSWSDNLQEFVGAELKSITNKLSQNAVTRPEQAWQVVSTQIARMGGFCAGCSTPDHQIGGYFAIDAAGTVQRSGRPPPDAVLRRVWSEIRSGHSASLSDVWRAGLYFQTHAGTTHAIAAFTRLDAAGEPEQAYGFEVSPETTREILQLAFARIPILSTKSEPIEALFAVDAAVSGTSLLRGDVPVRATLAPPPEVVIGLELGVGVRPEAVPLLVVQQPAGRVTGLLALLVLIGALIVLAVVLVRREAELVKLRADFISSVSHELRTPLAQIRMFTETLLLGRVRSDLDRRRSLEIIDQEARRLTNLIENVLLFSKSEGGRPPKLSTEPTIFATEVRQAVESFGPLSRLKDVEIRTELQANIAAQVDRCALRQILVNLIDNALKYGPKGQRITIGVALFDDKARLWVDDEGPGVPLADRVRIFDSFVRLARGVEAHTGGSGIGLAVVRELARLHGGSAWVEAAPGAGARFLIEFPDAYLHTELSAADLAAAS